MPSLAVYWCLFWLMRHCFLGRWICLPVSERFRLVWRCRLFDYRKNQNGIRRILEGEWAKNLLATWLFVDFTKAFDSIHRGKMEQILQAYSLPNETIAAITILYRNTKVKVWSPDGDTEYFNIVAGVLQGDTLAQYLFIICLDYMLRTSIDKISENGFKLTKKRSRRYPTKTITDANYADDIAILANTPDQAKTLLHSLEWANAGNGLHINALKLIIFWNNLEKVKIFLKIYWTINLIVIYCHVVKTTFYFYDNLRIFYFCSHKWQL